VLDSAATTQRIEANRTAREGVVMARAPRAASFDDEYTRLPGRVAWRYIVP
jgi:hypothetical protein